MARVWIARAVLASASWTVRLASRWPVCTLVWRLGGLRIARQRADELIARGNVEFREHLVQVVLDRARADEQPRADLRVGQPFACQLGDLALLRRQLV